MKFLLVLLSLLSLPVFGQVTFTTRQIEFGDLFAMSERFQDVLVTNHTKQKIYILRVEKPKEIVYRSSSDQLLPDSSLSFRVQLNPVNVGKQHQQIRVFLSDRPEPVILTVASNVRELPADNLAAMQNCPEFGVEPSRVKTNTLTIITVDEETREPVSQSTVTILRNGTPTGSWITGRKGSFEYQSTAGYFYFYAAAQGYYPREAGAYVGPQVHEITIPLKKDQSEIVPAVAAVTFVDTASEVVPEQAEAVLEEALKKEEDPAIPQLASIPADNFSDQYFKPVNVVFVIDISGSMKTGDKMELMKYSLNQLVDALRPQDHVAMVTYADDAETLIEPTSGSDKEVLRNQVALLKADGLTAGGKGIKLGYKQAMHQYSPEKANMVIIITDGAFNRSSDDYQKVVQKYAGKGITFSVVGIQDRKSDEEKMTEAATFGRGRYISIDKLADARIGLIDEIRLASYKGL